jgi:hypothetical protein
MPRGAVMSGRRDLDKMTWLAHRDVAVMALPQEELAAIEKRLKAHWTNITNILPNANWDVVLEQVSVIACICADRAPLGKRVKLFEAAAITTYKAAAALGALDPMDRQSLLAQAGADQGQCSVLRKICDEARQSAYVKGSSCVGRRQRERAAKEAAALAALHNLKQTYPERVITLALVVELSENLFEAATGREATNMHNICALVIKRHAWAVVKSPPNSRL